MSKGIIAVDVDLTVANSDVAYWAWLHTQGHFINAGDYEPTNETEELDYNLSNYFDLPKDVKGLDFWRLPDLYDEKPSR